MRAFGRPDPSVMGVGGILGSKWCSCCCHLGQGKLSKKQNKKGPAPPLPICTSQKPQVEKGYFLSFPKKAFRKKPPITNCPVYYYCHHHFQAATKAACALTPGPALLGGGLGDRQQGLGFLFFVFFSFFFFFLKKKAEVDWGVGAC